MVSVLAFYSDDPSSNPAEVYNFSVKLLLKRTKINKKRPGLAHFLKKCCTKSTIWSTDFCPCLFPTNSQTGLSMISMTTYRYLLKLTIYGSEDMLYCS